MRMAGRLLLVAVLVLGGLIAGGSPALAHNELTGSNPEEGESLEQAPDEVRLEFLAAVDANNAEFGVTGPDGSSVMADDARVDEDTVLIPVDPGPAGDYEVAWRVLSSDGDWVDGTVAFTVTVGEEPSPSPSPTEPAATTPTPSPSAAADPVAVDAGEESGSGSTWWVWVLIALALAGVAGYVGYRLRRRAGQPT
jgi:methionine-rich copper-binding protein CopC